MCAPCSTTLRMEAEIAIIPADITFAASVPSNIAIFRSTTSRVGLLMRL